MVLSPMVKKGLGHAVGVPVAVVIYVTAASAVISALTPFLTGMVAAGSDDLYGVDGAQWAAWILQFGIAFCGGVGAGLLYLSVKLYGLYARWLEREVDKPVTVSPLGTARAVTLSDPKQPTARKPRRGFVPFDVLAKKRNAQRRFGVHEDTEDVAEAEAEAIPDHTAAEVADDTSVGIPETDSDQPKEVIDGEELEDILALEKLDLASPPDQVDTDQVDSDIHDTDTNKDAPHGKPIQ